MTAIVGAATHESAAISSDQNLTAHELERARLFLRQTQNTVVGATKGLSEAQWRFKPAPDRWSITENLVHIVIVQDRVLGPILEQLADAPAPPSDLDYRLVDAIVINQFPNRLSKYSAPEFVRPVGEIAPTELLTRLSVNYGRLADRLESTAGLRQHWRSRTARAGIEALFRRD
jgi:hypothetical protein